MKRLGLILAMVALALAPSTAGARSRVLSFYAQVLHAGPQGVALRAADGRTVRFPADQIASVVSGAGAAGPRPGPLAHLAAVAKTGMAPSAALEPGITVLVTETVAHGVHVTLTVPAASAPEHATGVVRAVGPGGLVLAPAGGPELTLAVTPSTLSQLGVRVRETVRVIYHQAGTTLRLDGAQPF